MAKSLDGLGLEGQKVLQAIGLMGKNTDIFRKAIAISNEEMKNGTSLANEFAVKNDNLAANIEKFKKAISSGFAGSELEGFLNTIFKFLSGIDLGKSFLLIKSSLISLINPFITVGKVGAKSFLTIIDSVELLTTAITQTLNKSVENLTISFGALLKGDFSTAKNVILHFSSAFDNIASIS